MINPFREVFVSSLNKCIKHLAIITLDDILDRIDLFNPEWMKGEMMGIICETIKDYLKTDYERWLLKETQLHYLRLVKNIFA